jgi:hypothetical protein
MFIHDVIWIPSDAESKNVLFCVEKIRSISGIQNLIGPPFLITPLSADVQCFAVYL